MSKSSLQNNHKVARRRDLRQKAIEERASIYVPPTHEQLVNFVCMVAGAVTPLQREVIELTLTTHESSRAAWLRKHREFQAGLDRL